MRKNVKNDKVIKAITIGLAAMIAATSIPTSVYADEAEGADNSSSRRPANLLPKAVRANRKIQVAVRKIHRQLHRQQANVWKWLITMFPQLQRQ